MPPPIPADARPGGLVRAPTRQCGRGRPARTLPMTHIRRAKALVLAAAGLSFLLSVSLWFLADREQGLFVGLWVPSILAFGALILGGKEGGRG